MVVAPAGREEPERRRDLADRGTVVGIEAAVVDLEAAQSDLDELAQELEPRRRLAKMG